MKNNKQFWLNIKSTYSTENEEKFFINEMKRIIDKKERENNAIKEEINSITRGKQIVLKNYKSN